jgi:hypothetical protein
MKIIGAFAVGLALAGVLSAAPAQAQNARSFVSPTGSDAAACTLAAPCRTFAAAVAVTNAGGEIAVLGTAGYGALTINKAISIVNGGGFEAGITVPSGGTGIVISAGANDAVSLRGLSIDGAGVGTTGIQFNIGASLTVENCVIRNVTNNGIDFLPSAGSTLFVSNTLVAYSGEVGINVSPSSGFTLGYQVRATLNRVEAINNNYGISVNGSDSIGTVRATVSESVAHSNTNAGFYVATASSSTAPTTLMVFHSVASNNVTGLQAEGYTGATLLVAQSTVTGNTNGWTATGGVVQSYGDNYIDGNTTDQVAPPSIVRK